MSLSRRKDGRWIVKYKEPVSGVWKQKAFRNREEAERFNDDTEYDAGQESRLTLRECVTLFLQNVPHCEKGLWVFSFLINGHDCKNGRHTEGPAEFLANKYCAELNRRDLENLRLRIKERNVSIGTVNAYVARLKAAMSWAVQQDFLAVNPWAKYRALPGYKGKHMSGTLEDFRKVYERLPEWAQWACRTMIALCLRPGKELLGVKWDAFDWQGRFVSVYMPKVDRVKTVYPPDVYLAEAWERYQEDRAAGREYVIPEHGAFAFTAHWTRARNKAGVAIPVYAMRHIAASQMLYGGADIAAVAAQLGHASVATTTSTYVHALESGQRRAAQTLPVAQLVRIGAEKPRET